MSALLDDRARARLLGRCMGCGEPLQHPPRGRRRILCSDPECRRYYQAIYYECVTLPKRRAAGVQPMHRVRL